MAAMLLMTAFCSSLHGQVVYVDKNALGANDGSSWLNAYSNLQTALDNTTSGQIWVADATYNASSPFAIKSAVQLYGGFAGTETQLSQRNPSANPAILSGDIMGNDPPAVFDSLLNLDNALHVVYVDSLLTGTVVIDGFTIKGGITDNDNTQHIYFWKGGGIHAQSKVQVRNCAFSRNWARTGGSIYIGTNADGSEVRNCSFTLNGTSSQSAGIYTEAVNGVTISKCNFINNDITNRGMIYPFRSTDVLIDSCRFEENTNATGFGGAIFDWNCVDIVISNSEFINNTATNAGAININGSELTGVGADNLIIENCLFEDNSVTDFGGGSIYNSAADYTVRNCTFKGGQATNGTHIFNSAGGRNIVIENTSFEDAVGGGWGGALTCYGLDADYQVTGCTFKNNQTANLGGAVNNGFGAIVTYTDCLFENNMSLTSAGGALALQNDSTSIIVNNCEFTGNTASTSGGAIFSGASESSGILTVDGSTFLANSAGTGGAIYQNEAGDDDISTLTLSNSVFGLNGAASQGGAINLGDADATITSCLFFQNSAADTGTGGAISNNVTDSNTVVVNIVNCTFAQNSGLLAAGIANWTGTSEVSSDMNLQNNIFWQEGGINYAIEAGTPVATSLGGNLSDDYTMELFLTHAKDINGEEATFVDPDDYDYHLTDGSVGVNDGVAAGAPATDLEGNPRKDQVDMGAYENQTALAAGEKLLANNGMLRLMPNPAKGTSTQLRLENNWKGNLQMRIMDVNGKVALTQTITKSGDVLTMQVPLTLPAGLYSVQVSNGQELVVEKLVRL